jgi:3-phenylpropionate/trans-cinnamate dioxygenase ferredoxin subunit
MPTQRYLIGTKEELPPGTRKVVDVNDHRILFISDESGYFALDEICSHEHHSLADGEFTNHMIECPQHGARFDIKTGAPRSLPAVKGIRVFPVVVEDDGIKIIIEN